MPANSGYDPDMAQISHNDRGTALRTVQRAIAVLNLIAARPEPPRVRDVARELGINLSTTYHLANTLMAGGYLARDDDGGLRVGPQIGVLYAALERGTDHSRLLRPYVDALASESGETAYLTRWDRGSVVIAAVAEGRQSLRVTGLQVGFSGFEDRRASGRAVLAYLPEAAVAAVVDRLFRELAPDERAGREATLAEKLAAVRALGYATDEEDYEPGICCVAAPYFDAAGKVAGSVTVSAPIVRLGTLRTAVLPRVRAVATEITRVLRGGVSQGAERVNGPGGQRARSSS